MDECVGSLSRPIDLIGCLERGELGCVHVSSTSSISIALLLGCILQSSPRYAERIRSRLPEPGKFRPLAIMLAKLLSFLSLARGVETAGSESILRIVRTLEAQDQPQQPSTSTSPTISRTGPSPPVTRSALRARHD